MMLEKHLESIKEEDLQELLESKLPEGKNIEYKQTLPGNSDADKKEFLADISSFANATGGHLFYGIRAESGIPVEILGLKITPDDEKLRLESTIRDGIEPRIFGLGLHALPVTNSGYVLIIRIPRSWSPPHGVKTKSKHYKFFSRNSAGKYPLDLPEIRAAFALSESIPTRIRDFRAERLSKIVAGETPVPLPEKPKIVLHIAPFSAFGAAARFDLSILLKNSMALRLINGDERRPRHNFDGLVSFSYPSPRGMSDSYVQLFRNGSIESVNANLVGSNPKHNGIPSLAFEQELLEAFPQYLSIQKTLGVEPPFFVMLSMLGVRGYRMAVPEQFRYDILDSYAHPVDRDDLLIPEVTVENLSCEPAKIMKEPFDAVWNAAGWPISMNYDESGKRIR